MTNKYSLDQVLSAIAKTESQQYYEETKEQFKTDFPTGLISTEDSYDENSIREIALQLNPNISIKRLENIIELMYPSSDRIKIIKERTGANYDLPELSSEIKDIVMGILTQSRDLYSQFLEGNTKLGISYKKYKSFTRLNNTQDYWVSIYETKDRQLSSIRKHLTRKSKHQKNYSLVQGGISVSDNAKYVAELSFYSKSFFSVSGEFLINLFNENNLSVQKDKLFLHFR